MIIPRRPSISVRSYVGLELELRDRRSVVGDQAIACDVETERGAPIGLADDPSWRSTNSRRLTDGDLRRIEPEIRRRSHRATVETSSSALRAFAHRTRPECIALKVPRQTTSSPPADSDAADLESCAPAFANTRAGFVFDRTRESLSIVGASSARSIAVGDYVISGRSTSRGVTRRHDPTVFDAVAGLLPIPTASSGSRLVGKRARRPPPPRIVAHFRSARMSPPVVTSQDCRRRREIHVLVDSSRATRVTLRAFHRRDTLVGAGRFVAVAFAAQIIDKQVRESRSLVKGN